MPCPNLLTPGRIASDLGVPLHRVQYILSTRGHIQPSARAGTIRLFDKRAMAQIRHELTAIAARRDRRNSLARAEGVKT